MTKSFRIVSLKDIDDDSVMYVETTLTEDEFEDYLEIAQDLQHGGYINEELSEDLKQYIRNNLNEDMSYEMIITKLARHSLDTFKRVYVDEWRW